MQPTKILLCLVHSTKNGNLFMFLLPYESQQFCYDYWWNLFKSCSCTKNKAYLSRCGGQKFQWNYYYYQGVEINFSRIFFSHRNLTMDGRGNIYRKGDNYLKYDGAITQYSRKSRNSSTPVHYWSNSPESIFLTA